jgi:hypothetical protein
MNVKLHHPKALQRFGDISRKEHNAKQKERYRAVLFALQGQTTEAIVKCQDFSVELTSGNGKRDRCPYFNRIDKMS